MRATMDKACKGKGKGKERTVNARFAVMCSHYRIDADFCNVVAG